MGYATVISLEEFRQERAREEARRELHERFDRWLDQVEGRVTEERPTLEQLRREIFAMRQDLTGMVAEALVGQAYAEALEQQRMPCPHCGRILSARGSPDRTVETMVGAVSLTRPYFYCVQCRNYSCAKAHRDGPAVRPSCWSAPRLRRTRRSTGLPLV